jgi:hypothetical protein
MSILVKFKTPTNLIDYVVTDDLKHYDEIKFKYPNAELQIITGANLPNIATLTRTYDRASRGLRLENYIPKLFGLANYRKGNLVND